MTSNADRGTRWRLVHDVVVFQIKLGMEGLLNVALIPTSLAAAGLDLLVGNWRRPRFFHGVLQLGERCETWIDLWGVPGHGADERRQGADAVMQSIEAVIRDPETGPHALRMLRRWAATKLIGNSDLRPPHDDRNDDTPT